MSRLFIAGIIFLSAALLLPAHVSADDIADVSQEIFTHDTLFDSLKLHETPNTDSISDQNFRKEKIIAAVLAFPVPFGFTGLHRIYLGSEPWVPVAYLITGGGGCGLLPLLDFIFILSADEEEFKSYENNPHFFMWVK